MCLSLSCSAVSAACPNRWPVVPSCCSVLSCYSARRFRSRALKCYGDVCKWSLHEHYNAWWCLLVKAETCCIMYMYMCAKCNCDWPPVFDSFCVCHKVMSHIMTCELCAVHVYSRQTVLSSEGTPQDSQTLGGLSRHEPWQGLDTKTDWLTDWPTDRPTDWLTDEPSVVMWLWLDYRLTVCVCVCVCVSKWIIGPSFTKLCVNVMPL
jgi:hypothetical protein